MRLVFLGTSGAVPTGKNGNLSFAVGVENTSVLIDASGNPVQNLLRAGFDPLELDAVILTHAHTDHIYGLPSLLHALWMGKREKPLLIVANPVTAAFARELSNLFRLLQRENLFSITWEELEDGQVSLSEALKVGLFPVEHSTPTSGVKLITGTSVLVYSCDTSPCRRVIEKATGAQALIHEASGNRGLERRLNPAGHSSARQAGEVAARAGVKTLFLAHFDYRVSLKESDLEAEASESFSGEVIVPELFKEYEI
ncbi:MAG: MBL fold metallo-hydrolase [Proteobacteria bacterium]|nr:MBL fold metallo-hydrolase [Pseudomonadota bacterium]